MARYRRSGTEGDGSTGGIGPSGSRPRDRMVDHDDRAALSPEGVAVLADGVGVATDLAQRLASNLGQALRGKPEAVRLGVVALLSGGHLLVEDVPGVGKTLLAKALARSLGGTFARIQGTPDLLPSELTGTNVFQPLDGSWEFRPGPLFAHVVLFDEVNRATPRTQSALLEAMEEHQVTVDGVTRPLPEPFFVVATQNPFEHAGTFPLLEGQRDRFAAVARLGPPDRHTERELLLGTGGINGLDRLVPVATPESLLTAMAAVREVHCAPAVADYVIDVIAATRSHPAVVTGASPRASLSLLDAAKATAAMSGRSFVIPDDVKAVAVPALAHRLVLGSGSQMDGGAAVVADILRAVPVPRR